MSAAKHKVGDTFPVQFAWKLPNGDYLRAVFQAEVLGVVATAEKYLVRLNELLAGRQEDADGVMRSQADMALTYWAMVGQLVGNTISVAHEAEDGRALPMRLATLTGEHDFFWRFNRQDRPSPSSEPE